MVQETVLSKKVNLVVGDASVGFELLPKIAQNEKTARRILWIAHFHFGLASLFSSGSWERFVGTAQIRIRWHRMGRLTLLQLLYFTRFHMTTEPRDQVFA